MFDRDLLPESTKLHLGCGSSKVATWLNVDLIESDFDLDLGSGRLPWRSSVFESVVSEHLIEHLDLMSELIPLLREVHRVMVPGGDLWLSCPDIETICRAYLDNRIPELISNRKRRHAGYFLGRPPLLLETGLPSYPVELLGQIPASHMVNEWFHQWGQHRNLFDFELLEWTLTEAGFSDVKRANGDDLAARFPEFPKHADADHGIILRATAKR